MQVELYILDWPIQCASFYLERIGLGSKLRELYWKWRLSLPFSGQSPLTSLQKLTHQISLLAGLHSLNDTFHQKNKK